MKRKSISVILIAGIMTASMLTGCGTQAADSAPQAGQRAVEETEQEGAEQ